MPTQVYKLTSPRRPGQELAARGGVTCGPGCSELLHILLKIRPSDPRFTLIYMCTCECWVIEMRMRRQAAGLRVRFHGSQVASPCMHFTVH